MTSAAGIAVAGGALWSLAAAIASQDTATSAATERDDLWAIVGFSIAAVGACGAISALRARERAFPGRLGKDGETYCVPRHHVGRVAFGFFGGVGALGVALVVLFPLLTSRSLAGPVTVGVLFVVIGFGPVWVFGSGRLVPQHLEIGASTVRWLNPRSNTVRSIARDSISSVAVESDKVPMAVAISDVAGLVSPGFTVRVRSMTALRFRDRCGEEIAMWPGSYGDPIAVARAFEMRGIPALLQPPPR